VPKTGTLRRVAVPATETREASWFPEALINVGQSIHLSVPETGTLRRVA